MGHVEAELVSDPVPGLFDLALVTGGAEPPGLAGEGEQLFVAALRALKAGEPDGEITTAVELIDDGHGILSQRTMGLAVGCLVVGDKVAPAV